MDVTIIGAGFIGTTLGKAFAEEGHRVTLGSRHPDREPAPVPGADVEAVPEALSRSDVIVLALPASAVGELGHTFERELAGKLIVDATNRMQGPTANSRDALPPTVRYARVFNTVGGENLADPVFDGERADMFFSSPAGDRPTVEALVEAVGMRPVFVGEDEEELVDAVFRLWIALAAKQGRGRRLAFRLLEP